jgi:hypothetical protein
VARSTYQPEDFGAEIAAPSGYYRPVAEGWLDCGGRRVLYVMGTACIEASCCGVGSWNYLRVEGFVSDDAAAATGTGGRSLEVDTIEDAGQKEEIARLLGRRYPGARIEFR